MREMFVTDYMAILPVNGWSEGGRYVFHNCKLWNISGRDIYYVLAAAESASVEAVIDSELLFLYELELKMRIFDCGGYAVNLGGGIGHTAF